MNKMKKKLPCFALGTRKAGSLGYQPSQEIGTMPYNSVAGENIQPETTAMNRNVIPGTLNKLQQHLTPAMSMYQSMITPAQAAAENLLRTQTATQLGRQMMSMPGLTGTGAMLQQQAANGAFNTTKAGLSTAGKVAGGVGLLYSAYDIGNQLGHMNDIRSTQQMRNTLSTDTYYTPGGNSYIQYGQLNRSAEREYEDANRRQKQNNLAGSTAGAGGTAGMLIGGPLGLGIGTAAGWLVGKALGWFGLGDNEAENERLMTRLDDSTSMQNRQNRASAIDKDISNGFHAALGKQPNARVSNGELIGNFNEGWAGRVPGRKNNNDTVKTFLKPSDFVISNKFGLSDYAAATGDYAGALSMQDILMNGNSNNYKCGKLPKFANGTMDYVLATLPHFGQYLAGLSSYNRAKYADTNIPVAPTESPLSAAAASSMIGDQERIEPYLRRSDRKFAQAAYNNSRNVGLGYGGRAIASNALFRQKLDADNELALKINESNRAQRNQGRNKFYELGMALTNLGYDQTWKRAALAQQANAAKENWMTQEIKNQVMAGINGAADLLRLKQFNQSRDYYDRMLDLYGQQVATDRIKALSDWYWNPTSVIKDRVTDDPYGVWQQGRLGEAARKSYYYLTHKV